MARSCVADPVPFFADPDPRIHGTDFENSDPDSTWIFLNYFEQLFYCHFLPDLNIYNDTKILSVK